MSRQQLMWFATAFAAARRICGAACGSSLYDAMGLKFTLLRFDPALAVAPLGATARSTGVSLKVLDIERPATAIFYGGGLALSRPDQHVAWRGDAMPADSPALIDRVRGASKPG
jgi:hypothetical protein